MTTPPDTRPSAITEEQLNRLLQDVRRMLEQRGGGGITVTDPRVSQVQTWILGLVGMGLIAAGCWVGQSINVLSTSVAAAVLRLDQQDKTQDDHEARLRSLERRP